jgi:hypothetical protein
MAHDASGATFFMIVSLPGDAAATICCSIDFPIFAVRFCQEDDEPLDFKLLQKKKRNVSCGCLLDERSFLGSNCPPPLLGSGSSFGSVTRGT